MSPPPLPSITALYAGVLALLLLLLAVRVSWYRYRFDVLIGDGGRPELQRAMRAHGNAVEWAVPALLLLLVAELTRAPVPFVHGCGLALVVGRLLHAFGLSRQAGHSFGRFWGSALSWSAFGVLALWCIWAFARLLLV